MDIDKETIAGRLVEAVALFAGGVTVFLGLWAYVAPGSFADFADFPDHTHFVHDLAAFQLGIGTALMLAVIWTDPLATMLAGFLLANTAHVANHVADLDHGGRAWQIWALAILSLAVAAALGLRLRALDYVVGAVDNATDPTLFPYVRCRTALLTGPSADADSVPVSVAVDGNHAYASCFETSAREEWLGDDARVRITPAWRGEPTGTRVPVRIRRLDGADARRAARLLRRKYPLLHGFLRPLSPRLGPQKDDTSVFFVLTSRDDGS